MKTAAERATDYLNWYYITQSTEVGADFTKYRKLSDSIESEVDLIPKQDHLENYLNRTEQLFINK